MELEGVPDFDSELEFWKGVYESEADPLAIWEAVKYCCSSRGESSKREFPDWVMEYLQQVSLGFLGIDAPEKQAAPKIKEILKFDDARIFSRHRRHEKLKQELYGLAKEAVSREARDLLLKKAGSKIPKEYIEAIMGIPEDHFSNDRLRTLAEEKGVSYESARALYYIALKQAKSDYAEESELLEDSQKD